jgi:hypothetical protein
MALGQTIGVNNKVVKITTVYTYFIDVFESSAFWESNGLASPYTL